MRPLRLPVLCRISSGPYCIPGLKCGALHSSFLSPRPCPYIDTVGGTVRTTQASEVDAMVPDRMVVDVRAKKKGDR
jgi:hypothetical protein